MKRIKLPKYQDGKYAQRNMTKEQAETYYDQLVSQGYEPLLVRRNAADVGRTGDYTININHPLDEVVVTSGLPYTKKQVGTT